MTKHTPNATLSARSPSSNLSSLSRLYLKGEWALLTEVRNSVGGSTEEVLRTADAIAVKLWGGVWCAHWFERKDSRGDWLRERARPEKAAPFKLYCEAAWLVVPAPRKNVIHDLDELPAMWGLIELGAGGPEVIVKAVERKAEDPSPGFVRALLRAAMRDPEHDQEDDDGPRVLITRPNLSRHHVGLACGHVALRPLAKVLPKTLVCLGCAGGHPTDLEMVAAAIADATAEEVARLSDLIAQRCAALGAGAPGAAA